MNIKQQVLEVLIKNKGNYASGQKIAKAIHCSRNAVWKSVKSLQDDGFEISSVTGKGYCLEESDVFSPEIINRYLDSPLEIKMYQSLPSTNTAIKQAAQQGKEEGFVVIAQQQTQGKGRLGRSFYSPADSGIYFSVLLRPKISLEDSVLLTTAAAVAVVRAIKQVTGKQASIKWVNDVFLNSKKICGILTQASVDFESGMLQYAALGIGLNIFKPKDGFGEIENIADSIFPSNIINKDIKARLSAYILNEFFKIYRQLPGRDFLQYYKEHCFIINKKIQVINADKKFSATAVDINDKAHLIVKLNDGTLMELPSGEISIQF